MCRERQSQSQAPAGEVVGPLHSGEDSAEDNNRVRFPPTLPYLIQRTRSCKVEEFLWYSGIVQKDRYYNSKVFLSRGVDVDRFALAEVTYYCIVCLPIGVSSSGRVYSSKLSEDSRSGPFRSQWSKCTCIMNHEGES